MLYGSSTVRAPVNGCVCLVALSRSIPYYLLCPISQLTLTVNQVCIAQILHLLCVVHDSSSYLT